MPLDAFLRKANKSARSSTVHDVFGRMLRQLPRCSGAQTGAILQRYPTLVHLVRAYDAVSEAQGIVLLQDITPKGGRRLGPALSRMAYYLFRGRSYGDDGNSA